MINLASNKSCDVFIRSELEAAGIRCVKLLVPRAHEVPAGVVGQLGRYKFERAWFYWIAIGATPLNVAVEIYNHPIGRASIWAEGYSGGADPGWVVCGRARDNVLHFHITTQEALNLFADTIRAHGLDRVTDVL